MTTSRFLLSTAVCRVMAAVATAIRWVLLYRDIHPLSDEAAEWNRRREALARVYHARGRATSHRKA